MIKINEASGVFGAGKAKKLRKTGDNGFEELLSATEESESAAPTAQAMPVSSVGSLLSLQEISEEEARRQRSMQQGKQSVDMLEQLRREILTGQASPAMIGRMQYQVEQIRQHAAPDPRLQEIMKEIELRLAVEAAKLEKVSFSA